MTLEDDIWQQVAAVADSGVTGYFPGALSNGLLSAVRRPPGKVLEYRAFRRDPGGELHAFSVTGIEVIPDYASARQSSEGAGQDPLVAIRASVQASEEVDGLLPTSDGATFVAVRTSASKALRVLSTWPDGAGSSVVVPARLSAPPSCLVDLGPVPAGRREASRSDGALAPPSPRSSRRIAVLAGAAVLALAAGFGAFRSGLFSPRLRDDPRPTTPAAAADSPVVIVPAAPSPPTSTEVASPAESTVAGRSAGGSRDATEPSRPTTRTPGPPARVVPPEPVRASDAASDVRELARLQDLATGTQPYTQGEWLALAASAERLVGRLVESANIGEAARVIVQAYTRAGGDPGACRYLAMAADVTAGERALFRQVNRCE